MTQPAPLYPPIQSSALSPLNNFCPFLAFLNQILEVRRKKKQQEFIHLVKFGGNEAKSRGDPVGSSPASATFIRHQRSHCSRLALCLGSLGFSGGGNLAVPSPPCGSSPGGWRAPGGRCVPGRARRVEQLSRKWEFLVPSPPPLPGGLRGAHIAGSLGAT